MATKASSRPAAAESRCCALTARRLLCPELDWVHVDSYVQAWAQLDPDATGIMKNDDELCQLLAMLPEPLRIFEEELPTDRDEKAAALQAISGAHPHSCLSLPLSVWLTARALVQLVISRCSRGRWASTRF